MMMEKIEKKSSFFEAKENTEHVFPHFLEEIIKYCIVLFTQPLRSGRI